MSTDTSAYKIVTVKEAEEYLLTTSEIEDDKCVTFGDLNSILAAKTAILTTPQSALYSTDSSASTDMEVIYKHDNRGNYIEITDNAAEVLSYDTSLAKIQFAGSKEIFGSRVAIFYFLDSSVIAAGGQLLTPVAVGSDSSGLNVYTERVGTSLNITNVETVLRNCVYQDNVTQKIVSLVAAGEGTGNPLDFNDDSCTIAKFVYKGSNKKAPRITFDASININNVPSKYKGIDAVYLYLQMFSIMEKGSGAANDVIWQVNTNMSTNLYEWSIPDDSSIMHVSAPGIIEDSYMTKLNTLGNSVNASAYRCMFYISDERGSYSKFVARCTGIFALTLRDEEPLYAGENKVLWVDNTMNQFTSSVTSLNSTMGLMPLQAGHHYRLSMIANIEEVIDM